MTMDGGNGIRNAIFVSLFISGISGGLAVEGGNSSISVNCSSNATFTCMLDGNCIPKTLHCDGKEDCADGSDEAFCASNCVGEDWFRCNNGHCISRHWLCDKEDDCMDWSDEADCKDDEVAALEPVTMAATCAGTDYKCGDGLCIPVSWTCDDQDDCHAGDDEDPKLCGKESECDQFTCGGTGACIPHRWVCDGGVDCQDGSDEDACGQERNGTDSCKYEQGQFPCQDGSQCLLANHVCDKISQCEDGSDEGSFCSQKLDCTNLTCSHKCIHTPSGPTCYCQPGYSLGADKTSCGDVDECKEFGSCSQGCENTVGSFICSCMEGYVMQNNSCLAVRGEPLLFFSTKSEVRGLKVRSMEYFPVATNLPYSIGIGFDSLGGRVYWTDVEAGKETLVSAGLDGSGTTELVTNGLDMPEDLVVDEINRNIYFTDSVRKHLAVCSIDGNGCSVLISDIEQPRAVAIHHKNRLVMYTDWGSKPAIVQVSMDGTNQKDLVNEDLVWPNGLAVDEVDDRVYWSDAKKDTVESIHMDGSDRRVILDMVAKHPFSMAVFEDSLYWSDWEMQEIVSCNKFSGKNFKTLVKEAGIRPMGITIAHPLLSHSGPPSPCKDSPCSHVCLPHPLPSLEYSCACPSHLSLDSTGTLCKATPQASTLLLSTSSQIYSLHPQSIGKTNNDHLASFASPSLITSMEGNGVDSMVYLVNRGKNGTILSLDRETGETTEILDGDQFGSICYDPLSNNMFWVDIHKMAVMVHSLSTGANMEVMFSSNSTLLSIMFVPEKNRLLVGEEGKLTVVRLGDFIPHVVSSTKLKSPTSMVYCSATDSVFIGDFDGHAIFKWKWGSEEVDDFMVNIGEVVSVAVDDGVLYWMEKSGTTLLWISVYNSDELSWLPISAIASPLDMLNLAVSGRPASKVSMNMDCIMAHCSHICINKDTTGYTCSCPYGMALARDKLTCQEHCAENVFSCGDGQCVPTDWRCDGSTDCNNKADEFNCTLGAEVISVHNITLETHPDISEHEKNLNLSCINCEYGDGKEYQEVRMEVTENSDGKTKGAILGIVITVVVAAVILMLIFCIRTFFGSKKKPADDMMFTNRTYGNAAIASDVELASVQIVSKGSAVGYDNPGFWPSNSQAKQDLSTVSEGGRDNDSAFQEMSIAASSVDNRHFSVGDEDEIEPHLSVSCDDRQKLI